MHKMYYTLKKLEVRILTLRQLLFYKLIYA